jgi:CHAT domain-containing protein
MPWRDRAADGIPRSRAALVRVLDAQRVVEGRLAGGFRHRGYSSSAPEPLPFAATADWRALTQGTAASLPEVWADRGVLHLHDQKWDSAIDSLDEASARESGNARIASDLAAAYLERGHRLNRATDTFLALIAAERAVAADPHLPEALFNQALAFERLGLRSRARAVWVRYLGLETESGWLSEGEEHLEALEHASPARPEADRAALEAAVESGGRWAVRSTVNPLRLRFRRLGEERLLADWAQAHLAGHETEAGRSLDLARTLGEVLSALSRDNLLRDTVAALDGASTSRREALARAHLDYREGRVLYAAADYAGAVVRLRAAQRALAREGSPFAWRAAFAVGSCEHYLSLRASALRHFGEVAAQAADRSYLSLLGESRWMEGLARFAERDVPPALTAYRRSLAAFEAIQETENIAGAHALIAEISDYEGEIEAGWQHRLAALQKTLEIGDPQRLFQVYAEATMAATRQGEPRAALYFQEEALRHARQAENPIAIVQALYWRSRNHQTLGLATRAGDDLRWARAVLADAKDSEIKERTEADISLAEAEVMGEEAPREAIPLLNRALRLYQQGGHRANLIEILRARARAFELLGDLAAAEEDLETAARTIEEWRERIETPAERISFLARSEQLFDALILLHLEGKSDPDRAFATLERQRARALLDSVLPATPPLAAHEIAARLPDNAVVVSYSLLADRLVAFVIDRHGLRQTSELSHDRPGIGREITALRAGLAGHADTAELNRRARSLYQVLIEPLAAAIPAGAHLILSAEGPLQRLPFAALMNPSTGRYLVQDHVLTMAPSASVYLASVEKFRRLAQGAPRSILLMSQPGVDLRRHPGLLPLPWAAAEARQTAALYPYPKLFENGASTIETFLREAPQAEIVHFLGHAIRQGGLKGTCLVLAAPPGAPNRDLLCGEEIERLRLDRTRLVILSACGTADGLIARGEGIESLARSFVAAGAPAVIATSWDVRDQASKLFLTELHRELKTGKDPSAALRSTQLRFIAGVDPDHHSPRFWANFQLTGGTT